MIFNNYDELTDEQIAEKIYKLNQTIRYAHEKNFQHMIPIAENALDDLKYVQENRRLKKQKEETEKAEKSTNRKK